MADPASGPQGKQHDLLILSDDVARFESQMNAYGVGEALEP